jgi:hypothetical protein
MEGAIDRTLSARLLVQHDVYDMHIHARGIGSEYMRLLSSHVKGRQSLGCID